MGSLRQQDSLCSQLCGAAAKTSLSNQGLAEECSQCGVTNVNINMPGSVPYYPGYSSYASYYPSGGYYPCYQSSYDPLEWYDYYFKYDPALAPYYEPWTPPTEEAAAEEEVKEGEEGEEEEEKEKAEEQVPEEEQEAPAEEEQEETAADETPEEEKWSYAWPRPHAQAAGTSTAGSFTMSNKKKPPRANVDPSGYNVVPIGGHKFDAMGDPIDKEMVFFDTSDPTMQPHPPFWK